MSAASLTVLLPCFNDSPTIGALVERAVTEARALVPDFEVIVVDDGSTDDSAAVLRSLQARYPELLRVIHHPVNRGYGAALRSGFRAAGKEWLFYTDGDGQYDLGELPLLFAQLAPGVGLVNGYKKARRDRWYRVLLGSAYCSVSRWMFRLPIRDVDCDFRLIRTSLLQQLDLRSTSGSICVELVRQIAHTGTGIREVAVSHYRRPHGRSQFFRLRPLLSTLFQYFQMMSRFRSAARADAE